MPRPLGRALVVGASGNVGGAIEEKYGAANVIGTYKNEARTEDGYVYLDIEAVAEDETLAEEIMTMCRPEVRRIRRFPYDPVRVVHVDP